MAWLVGVLGIVVMFAAVPGESQEVQRIDLRWSIVDGAGETSGPTEAGPAIGVAAADPVIAGEEFRWAGGTLTSRRVGESGWKAREPLPTTGHLPSANGRLLPVGDANLLLLPMKSEAYPAGLWVYHTALDRWSPLSPLPREIDADSITVDGSTLHALDRDRQPWRGSFVAPASRLQFIDQAVIFVYLAVIIGMGVWFASRGGGVDQFLLGGSRLPWWAVGASLFATGASAISVMAMPAKSFMTDWIYLSIGLAELLLLPLTIWVYVPLIRRSGVVSIYEYLETRFNTGVRLFGALLYVLMQVLARLSAVILLPAIAISTVTGLSVTACIILMGAVATLYTLLGGMDAVVWTDVVQAGVLIFSVLACFWVVLSRLDGGTVNLINQAYELDKLRLADFDWSLATPTIWVMLMAGMFTRLSGIADQNFVQRIQSTDSMRSAKLAAASQLGFALPMNLLFFAVGTAIFLFYRAHADQLLPGIAQDGILPFFVTQQLPVGLSGLIIAGIFAASMSSVDSSIHSSATVVLRDFVLRVRQLDDRQQVWAARVLTLLLGLVGTGMAMLLSGIGIASVWDLFLLMSGLVMNGYAGVFLLGFFFPRVGAWQAMAGLLVSTLLVLYVHFQLDVSFFMYVPIGMTACVAVGILFSFFSSRPVPPPSASAAV